MQVFLKRSDLSSNQDAEILAVYEEGVEVDPKWHGGNAAIVHVPNSAINYSVSPYKLLAGWRDGNQAQMMAAEATQRIDDVFPDYAQRNLIAEIEGYILQYGADSTKWPEAAKQRKAEFDRCWNYVEAIRSTSNKLAAAMPADPSADVN